MAAAVPAGWYADPWQQGLRYFDGTTWTEHTCAVPGPVGPQLAAAVAERPAKVSPPVVSVGATWIGLVGAIGLSVLAAVPVLVLAAVTGAIDVDALSTATDPGSQVLEQLVAPLVVASSLGMWAGFLAAFAWAARASKLRWRDAVGWQRVGRMVLVGLAVGVAVRGPLLVLELLVGLGGDGGSGGSSNNIEEALGSSNVGWLVAVCLCVCVGAPIFEELFFRGVMLPTLSRPLPVWGAVAVSTLIFGALHLGQQSPAAVVVVTLAGGVFGVVRAKTGSVLPSVVAHMVFNTTSIALALLVS